jgi:hypothetical protein
VLSSSSFPDDKSSNMSRIDWHTIRSGSSGPLPVVELENSYPVHPEIEVSITVSEASV